MHLFIIETAEQWIPGGEVAAGGLGDEQQSLNMLHSLTLLTNLATEQSTLLGPSHLLPHSAYETTGLYPLVSHFNPSRQLLVNDAKLHVGSAAELQDG